MADEASVLRALARFAGGVSALLGIEDLTVGLAAVERKLARVLRNQEWMMADFTELNSKLDEQAAALSDVQVRIAEDVEALQAQIADLELDEVDQAAVNAAVSRIQDSVDTLKGIDPVKSADVPTEPTPEPEPTV